MTPTDYQILPGGPPLPSEIPLGDPIGIERWLIDVAVHARKVSQSKYTRSYWSQGKEKKRSEWNFSKPERKRWRVTLRWPFVQVSFGYDEEWSFQVQIRIKEEADDQEEGSKP